MIDAGQYWTLKFSAGQGRLRSAKNAVTENDKIIVNVVIENDKITIRHIRVLAKPPYKL